MGKWLEKWVHAADLGIGLIKPGDFAGWISR